MIISDNGSTDGTRDYLDTLRDPRIQIFKQERNLGIDGNLNFLFSKASTEIAYTLCADDYFYPDALSRVVNEWTLVPSDTGFIGFNWKETIKHNITAKYSYEVLPKILRPGFSQLAFFLFGNTPGNLSNVSAKVACVKAARFNESFRMAGDFEIWAKLSRTYTMVLSDTETCFVRRHEGVATKYLNKQGKLFGEHIEIYEILIDELSLHFDRQRLIDYFNIELCSYHLRDSIKAMVFGSLSNIKNYLSLESPILWPKWKRLLGCLPFALYEKGRLLHINSRAAGLLKEFEHKTHSVQGVGVSFDASPK